MAVFSYLYFNSYVAREVTVTMGGVLQARRALPCALPCLPGTRGCQAEACADGVPSAQACQGPQAFCMVPRKWPAPRVRPPAIRPPCWSLWRCSS
jgi:hypothetical protein